MDVGAGFLARPGGTDGMCMDAASRSARKLDGLLPPAVISPKDQLANAMEQLRAKERPIDKYTYLAELQATNENLYYAILTEHTHEAMPVVYTPTVGEACQKYSQVFRRSTGLWITHAMAGHVKEALEQWPEPDVRCIVFTDGERILGLGDLGACGMGIPVGKLALYSALAGIHPRHCLPVTIDVGTNNKAFLADPGYIGTRAERQPVGEGSAYDELVREFIEAACAKWPGLLLQFEDFGNKNAFRLLKRYQPTCCCFNDDIQGTACVVLGGLYSALKQIKKTKLSELKFLFQGAGEAGCGIAELIAAAIVEEAGGSSQLSIEEARKSVFLFDSKGLVVEGRPDGFRGRRGTLQHHKLPFAHTHAQETSFLAAVRDVRPDVIIGVSAQPGVFDEEVCKAMAEINETPIIFPLSNPTHKAECTAEQAYTWTGGKCIFASGSPFDPVTVGGKTFEPGQGNNAYIFPGIGLGLLEAQAKTCPDQVFILAAQTLAETVTEADMAEARISLWRLRDASSVAVRLASS